MRRINQLWRVCNSVYRLKKIGNLDSTTSYQHDVEDGTFAATFTISTDKHSYNLTIPLEKLEDVTAYLRKMKDTSLRGRVK